MNQPNHFKIIAATVAASNTGYKVECIVKVDVDAAFWTKAKRTGQLGALYGIDISNEVYRLSRRLVPAWNPMVDDKRRASDGVKRITLTYHFDNVAAAQELGLECFKAGGELIPRRSASVNLLAPRLSLVGAS